MRHVPFANHVLPVVLLTLALWGITPAFAQQVRVNSQTGKVGESITFTVSLHKTTQSIDAMGFILAYDPQVLRYSGTFTKGQLVEGFDFFDIYERQPGLIHVGGFTTQKAIVKGGTGNLAYLTFTVLTANNTDVRIVRAVDDLRNLQTVAGKFTSQ